MAAAGMLTFHSLSAYLCLDPHTHQHALLSSLLLLSTNADSNPSQEHDGSEHEEPKDRHAKHSDSGDSGLALDLLDDGKQQHKKAAALMANPPDPLQLLHDCRPIQAAAIVASYTVQQQGSGRKPRQPPSGVCTCICAHV